MDPLDLWIVLLGVVMIGGLELWCKAQLGAVVCTLGWSEDGANEAVCLMLVIGGGMLVAALCLGYPSEQRASVFLLTGLVTLEIALSWLVKTWEGGVKLGDGGFQPVSGRVVRWQDILSYQWTGRDYCELTLHLGSPQKRSVLCFRVPLAQKGTVQRYLTLHAPRGS